MKEKKYCEFCGKEITHKGATRFCCKDCYFKAHMREHYEKYLKDNSIAYGIQNMQRYKKYFLEEQSHKCAICGIRDTWNSMPIVFVLDHINGNADDNSRANLRLICPNCDSQLDTYKSKNKYSARRKYRK